MTWVLDLCSGLGGASEAFANHPLWEVVRIENNEKITGVAHTRFLDVNHWLDWLPRSIARREGIPYEPPTDTVEDCIDIINYIEPNYWLIENVSGAVNDFKVHLGDYRQRIGPFFLWGKFPHISMSPDWRHSKYDNDTWSSDPLRANKKAKWPLELSEALLDAVMTQSSLADWC
jgi:hypothetical protein